MSLLQRLHSGSILVKILTFLDIEDKVRFERVDKRWRYALRSVWSTQKVLVCTSLYFYPHELDCTLDYGRSGHSVARNDVLFLRNNVDAYCSLLTKCENLQALYWDHQAFDRIAGQLLGLCPRLEHLYIRRPSSDDLVKLMRQNVDGLKCLQLWTEPYLSNQEEQKSYYADLITFITSCKQLEKLDLKHFHLQDHLSLIGRQILPQIKDLSLLYRRLNMGQTLELVQRFRWSVERLSLLPEDRFQVGHHHIMKIPESLPRLRSIRLASTASSVYYFVAMKSVREIEWKTRLVVDPEIVERDADREEDKFVFVEKTGERLKSLKVTSDGCESTLKTILKLYPDLEKMAISFNQQENFKLSSSYFAGFKGLRELDVRFAPINDRAVKKLLKKCPKLRSVSLFKVRKVTTKIFGYFGKYARLHSNRRVTLYVDHDFDQRTDRKGTEVKVEGENGNLWVYFVRIHSPDVVFDKLQN